MSRIIIAWPSSERHQLRNSLAAFGCAAVFGMPAANGVTGAPSGAKNTFTGAPTVGPPASPALPTSRQASSWSQFCSVDNSRKHAGHHGLVISSRSGAGGADGE